MIYERREGMIGWYEAMLALPSEPSSVVRAFKTLCFPSNKKGEVTDEDFELLEHHGHIGEGRLQVVEDFPSRDASFAVGLPATRTTQADLGMVETSPNTPVMTRPTTTTPKETKAWHYPLKLLKSFLEALGRSSEDFYVYLPLADGPVDREASNHASVTAFNQAKSLSRYGFGESTSVP